jgi:hypothetical protein
MDVLHAATPLRMNLRRVLMDFFMTCSEGNGSIWNIQRKSRERINQLAKHTI